MATASAWYSIASTDRAVYHDNTDCPEGQRILRENRREGKGGRPRCDRCSEMD